MSANESADSLGLANDKEWARKYLLDPLTCPAPNQETGPGSSFKKQPRGSSKLRDTESLSHPTSPQQQDNSKLPTPPPSASPKTTSFSLSNLLRRASLRSRSDKRPAVLQSTGRSRSAESDNITLAINHQNNPKTNTDLPTPVTSPTTTKYPPNTRQTRNYCAYNNDAGPSRSTHGESSGTKRLPLPPSQPNPSANPFPLGHRHTSSGPGLINTLDYRANLNHGLRKSNSTNTRRPAPPPPPSASSSNFSPGSSDTAGIRRNRSLSERYKGDMSHRPLDMIKRDVRAAERAPHSGGRRRYPNTDQIDSLDDAAFGGAYHHDGPYDATLASRNVNPMYSPVEAVRESNIEALKATPREFVQDSLEKHVPLQGTAVFPPGERAFGGRVMQYEEGADLMREADAPGGAYGRWEGQKYHPNDLKGKGEPSYTFEKVEKEKKEQRRLHKDSTTANNEIEMQPGTNQKNRSVIVRQRSVSSAAAEPRTTYLVANGGCAGAGTSMANDESGLRRSNTTGKRLSEGIRRRFGSIRRKGKGVSAAGPVDADSDE